MVLKKSLKDCKNTRGGGSRPFELFSKQKEIFLRDGFPNSQQTLQKNLEILFFMNFDHLYSFFLLHVSHMSSDFVCDFCTFSSAKFQNKGFVLAR